jgi:predicted transcriptional regulator
MSRKRSSSLTDGELRIMRALWDLERATVSEVIGRMRHQNAEVPAYNSVLTILGILERKGYVRHQKDGRAFLFRPTVDRAVARNSALQQLLAKFFDGSPSLLVLDLFGQREIDDEELTRIRELLDRQGRAGRKAADRRKA